MIAIIAILAALLMPVLSRAREAARRIVCLNNLKQHIIAAQMYGEDYENSLPPHVPFLDRNDGWCAIWFTHNNELRGSAILVTEGYMPAPQSLYCPSVAPQSFLRYGALSADERQGGWPTPEGRSPSRFVGTPYHNRATFHGAALGSKPLSLKDPPNLAAYSDGWTRKGTFDDVTGELGIGILHHVVGYNAVHLDGSGEWKPDSARALIYGSSSMTTGDHSEFEAVWTSFFDLP